ncbi:MAG: phosphoenolpyruvate--protein phosphotransferase [Oscillospiraceae bacterium]
MTELHGVGVSEGIAVGKICFCEKADMQLEKNCVENPENETSDEKIILCCDEAVPSEILRLEKSNMSALCTVQGSLNSHAAILARTMHIPAILNLGKELSAELNGKIAVVDGSAGVLYVDPDEKILAEMTEKYNEEIRKYEIYQDLKGKENVTPDGVSINVYANINRVSEVHDAIDNDAGGIGLFRSEYLYLQENNYPDEELQFQTYKRLLEQMKGKKVIIRTADLGSDKKAYYLNLEKEKNPALGFRAVRICLSRPDMLKTQLRALYRASAFGNLGIMFPLITSLEEIQEIKEIIGDVKNELMKRGEPFNDNVEIGIMVETPAAVMISDILAKEVDFFCIGTNDLTQFAFASDRQNPRLEKYCNPCNKALLRMIKITADNAHKNGIRVGVCGESAADLGLTEVFLAMGIDELSVMPSQILPLREKIRNTIIKDKDEYVRKLIG